MKTSKSTTEIPAAVFEVAKDRNSTFLYNKAFAIQVKLVTMNYETQNILEDPSLRMGAQF